MTTDDAHKPFCHVIAGMHIGRMTPRPLAGEFASVLTVAVEPGTVDDGIRHRHIPVSYIAINREDIEAAIAWVGAQVDAERTVLVRSEGGRQRPGLIVAGAILRLGGSSADGLACVRRADPLALSDFRLVMLLKQMEHGSARGALAPRPPRRRPTPQARDTLSGWWCEGQTELNDFVKDPDLGALQVRDPEARQSQKNEEGRDG